MRYRSPGTEFVKKVWGRQSFIVCVSMTSHRVHPTVVRRFCEISKMGDTLLNLYILVAIAQVPPLATPMVVVGAVSST